MTILSVESNAEPIQDVQSTLPLRHHNIMTDIKGLSECLAVSAPAVL